MTIVRALALVLSSVAPALVTLKLEYVLLETPKVAGAIETVWRPLLDVVTVVDVPPSGTIPAACALETGIAIAVTAIAARALRRAHSAVARCQMRAALRLPPFMNPVAAIWAVRLTRTAGVRDVFP